MIQKALLVAILSLVFQEAIGVKSGQNKNRRLSIAERKQVSEKFKSLSPDQVEQAKSEAVKSVEGNLIKMLQALSTQDSLAPDKVKADARSILKAVELGQLTDPLKSLLPKFLMNNPRNNPAKQLGKLLGNLQENGKARMNLGQLLPMDGLMKFLRSNMSGTNTLMKNLAMGSPDLLRGAMPALMGPMGNINESLDGTMTSVSDLLGGLMGGDGLLG